jgi:hypothetical protein
MGAYIHAATSFAEFMGVRSFARSWFWWYLLRIPIGAALALITYFALRGGLLAANGSSDAVNPYGVAALSALAGLFSKQAADKLSEVFDTLFRTSEGYGDDRRTDPLGPPVPTLKRLEPAQVPSSTDSDLVLIGSGFGEASAVLVKGKDAETAVVLQPIDDQLAESRFKVRITAQALASLGSDCEVAVINEAPGGVSQWLALKVT